MIGSALPQPATSSKAPFLILVVFAMVMAFLGYEMMQFRRAGKQVHGVEVRISPTEVQIAPGASCQFEASVRGIENADVGWTLMEGAAGGTLVSGGGADRDGRTLRTGARYTAPANPGTYHVNVTSKADETRSATATVQVLAK